MKGWKKIAVYALGGIAGLLVVTAASVYGFSESRYRKQYSVPASKVSIPSDSASVERGHHLAVALAACTDCHGEHLEGATVIEDPVIGSIHAPNLTRGKGGVGATLTDADFERAIRHGIDPSGRPLKVMPSSDYSNLSDADVSAVIAYVKSVPPVDGAQPASRMGPVGRALFLVGKLPILHAERLDHGRIHSASIAVQPTAEYGSYVASFGCKGCHGPQYAGGHIVDGPPDWAPAANLTPAGSMKTWSEEDFRTLLKTGLRPGGVPINKIMPIKSFQHLTDDEIHALYLYLKTLPAVPTPAS